MFAMVRVDLTTRFSYGVASGVEHSEFPLQVEGDHCSRGNNYYNNNNNKTMKVVRLMISIYQSQRHLSESHQPHHLLQLFHFVGEVPVQLGLVVRIAMRRARGYFV